MKECFKQFAASILYLGSLFNILFNKSMASSGRFLNYFIEKSTKASLFYLTIILYVLARKAGLPDNKIYKIRPKLYTSHIDEYFYFESF